MTSFLAADRDSASRIWTLDVRGGGYDDDGAVIVKATTPFRASATAVPTSSRRSPPEPWTSTTPGRRVAFPPGSTRYASTRRPLLAYETSCTETDPRWPTTPRSANPSGAEAS